MFRTHNLISLTIFEDIFEALTVFRKISLIKKHLHKQYALDEDTVCGGAAFIREYNNIQK
jgi:hypothetical protein